MKLLVIGSLNMDLVIETETLPKMGETVAGSGFISVCGGKGGNQAVAAAKLGVEVKMIGAVGKDIFGQRLVENLRQNGVDTCGIACVDKYTGTAVITIHEGDNQIIVDMGANASVTKVWIDENLNLIQWADVILLQMEIPYESVLYAVKTAKGFGKTVIINPAPASGLSKELFAYTDILIPNANEAEAILGYSVCADTKSRAVYDFLQYGCRQVIITLGSEGSVFNDGNIVLSQTAYAVEVVDTTAAGDSFIAGFIEAIGEKATVESAVKYASAVAALVVSRKGAADSLPDRSEVDKFIFDRLK